MPANDFPAPQASRVGSATPPAGDPSPVQPSVMTAIVIAPTSITRRSESTRNVFRNDWVQLIPKKYRAHVGPPQRERSCIRSLMAKTSLRLVPELPEVETIRARLAPRLTGRRFERVEISDPRLTRPDPPEAVAARLEGERVRTVGRRGKYLIVEFESGRHLLIHLRMTGNVQQPAPSCADA